MADNPKGELIAALAAQGMSPEFRVDGSGPAHAPSFVAEVWCDGQRLGSGTGGSRREAERRAARQALEEVLPGEGELVAGDFPQAEDGDAAAAGPWPLYPAVLAEALAVADSRLPQGTPLPEVAQRAATLYRCLLAELEHGPSVQKPRLQKLSVQNSGEGAPTDGEAAKEAP